MDSEKVGGGGGRGPSPDKQLRLERREEDIKRAESKSWMSV